MNEAIRIQLHRFTIWCQQSINRRIFLATATAGAFTGLAHLAAIVKELVVAHRFGTGDAMDAFLIAFLLPSSIMNIVAGSFNAALIPTYIQVREREGVGGGTAAFLKYLHRERSLIDLLVGPACGAGPDRSSSSRYRVSPG
ncbi:MAG: hypothetical protein MPW14_05250 [Candidatus Manganitrophus sp.]|nr:MAG: hypothetical protein MPW14_05250 [Candidatus Manganitrophus sp.]